jgi:hypothetical protein
MFRANNFKIMHFGHDDSIDRWLKIFQIIEN